MRWVVNLVDDKTNQPFVNAVALSLGRHGYERFTYATDAGHAQQTATELTALVNDYSFDKGSRFTDFIQGDKVAELGIAALVGTAAGATIAKTVGFGALLILLKKFFLVILAFGAGIFGWLKRVVGGGKKAPPLAMEPSSPYAPAAAPQAPEGAPPPA